MLDLTSIIYYTWIIGTKFKWLLYYFDCYDHSIFRSCITTFFIWTNIKLVVYSKQLEKNIRCSKEDCLLLFNCCFYFNYLYYFRTFEIWRCPCNCIITSFSLDSVYSCIFKVYILSCFSDRTKYIEFS